MKIANRQCSPSYSKPQLRVKKESELLSTPPSNLNYPYSGSRVFDSSVFKLHEDLEDLNNSASDKYLSDSSPWKIPDDYNEVAPYGLPLHYSERQKALEQLQEILREPSHSTSLEFQHFGERWWEPMFTELNS